VSNSEDVRLRLEAHVAALREGQAGDRRATKSARRRSTGAFLLRASIIVVAAVVFAVGLRTWVIQPFWIPSQSMEPTLHGCPNCRPDRLLVDKLSYHLHPVHRGDVVVFSRPPNVSVTDSNLVKRVVGLSGDVVRGANGSVYIDDHKLIEPYIASACDGTRDFAPITVPAGDVFVMGDNRCDSLDSRVFGPISTSLILGRAFVIVWPLSRIHWL
jgi:signal peptidase I